MPSREWSKGGAELRIFSTGEAIARPLCDSPSIQRGRMLIIGERAEVTGKQGPKSHQRQPKIRRSDRTHNAHGSITVISPVIHRTLYPRPLAPQLKYRR